MKHIAPVVAGFTLGALGTWWLASWMMGRGVPATYSDAQLRDNVRARLPEWVSDPDSVSVEVEAGVVRVAGPVAADEADRLLTRLTYLPGVYKVHNALTARSRSPAMQS